jgi:hypothetical protein
LLGIIIVVEPTGSLEKILTAQKFIYAIAYHGAIGQKAIPIYPINRNGIPSVTAFSIVACATIPSRESTFTCPVPLTAVNTVPACTFRKLTPPNHN